MRQKDRNKQEKYKKERKGGSKKDIKGRQDET